MIKPRATRVASAVTTKRVKAGESIAVSGTAAWKTPDGWAPVSAGRINVSACDAQDNCNSFNVVPVAADRTYTLTVTPFESTTLRSYYIPPSLADGSTDPYVATSQRDVPIIVLQESSIPRFTASRESSDSVHLHGSVELPGGHLTPGKIPVEFQFSEAGTGDWLTIGDDDQSYWDGEGGYEFEGRMAELRSGWWRALPGRPGQLPRVDQQEDLRAVISGVPGRPGPRRSAPHWRSRSPANQIPQHIRRSPRSTRTFAQ